MTVEDDLVDIVNKITSRNIDGVSSIGAAILAAAELDVCSDSRRFARIFEIGHAVVIRECNSLAEETGFLNITARKESSQSLHYSLPAKATSMLEHIRQDQLG